MRATHSPPSTFVKSTSCDISLLGYHLANVSLYDGADNG
jgi:hypothetical protein